MSFPMTAEVTCLDVHMLRLYGKTKPGLRVTEYEKYESDWIGRSRAAKVEPYMARMVYWDNLQGKPDSRYWSQCLEAQ